MDKEGEKTHIHTHDYDDQFNKIVSHLSSSLSRMLLLVIVTSKDLSCSWCQLTSLTARCLALKHQREVRLQAKTQSMVMMMMMMMQASGHIGRVSLPVDYINHIVFTRHIK